MEKPENLTDQDVERLANLFIESGLHDNYGVTFEAYLTAVAPVIAHVRGQ